MVISANSTDYISMTPPVAYQPAYNNLLPGPAMPITGDIGIMRRSWASILDIKRFFLGNRTRYALVLWFMAVVVLTPAWVISGDVNDRTVAVSMLSCGLSTFVIWAFRDKLTGYVQRWSWSSKWKFVTIGSLGALWAEFVFWAWERGLGANGVAASPNLLVDWLVTMPWYILMVYLFWKVVTKHEYSWTQVIVLGGIYELAADGIGGGLLGGGTSLALWPLIPLMVPIFMIVYSIIVLPCAVLLKDEVAKERAADQTPRKYNKYVYALYPVLGMVPYYIIFIIALLV